MDYFDNLKIGVNIILSYAYLAPRFFNRLPDSIKNLESMGSFKNKSSEWVQDIPYRMLGEILGFVP